MRSFVLAVTGRDRPGIVATLTRALLDHAVNIEDAEMAILRGRFAVILVLSGPDSLDDAALRERLEAVGRDVPLETASLTEVPALAHGSPVASHTISVYGADHPGIVHGVAQTLAGSGVNIVDLSTRVVGEEAAPLYVMLIDVTLPESLDEPGLEKLLAEVAAKQDVDVSVRAVAGDVL